MATANASMETRSIDLTCIGALHNHALCFQFAGCPDDMFRELNRLRADGVKPQIPRPSPAQKPLVSIENVKGDVHPKIPITNTSPPCQARGGKFGASTERAQKVSMKHWHAEDVHDQPWNPLRRGAGAGPETRGKRETDSTSI
jgi:hypothetical protein